MFHKITEFALVPFLFILEPAAVLRELRQWTVRTLHVSRATSGLRKLPGRMGGLACFHPVLMDKPGQQ